MREQVYARYKIHLQRFQFRAANAKVEYDEFDVGLPPLIEFQNQILCGDGEGGEVRSILASMIKAAMMIHGEVGVGHYRLVGIFDYPVRKDLTWTFDV